MANRARLAQRAAARTPAPRIPGRPGTDLTSRAVPISGTGAVRRTRNVRYSGSQTHGYESAWSVSPYYRTMTTHDPRMSRTVSEV